MFLSLFVYNFSNRYASTRFGKPSILQSIKQFLVDLHLNILVGDMTRRYRNLSENSTQVYTLTSYSIPVRYPTVIYPLSLLFEQSVSISRSNHSLTVIDRIYSVLILQYRQSEQALPMTDRTRIINPPHMRDNAPIAIISNMVSIISQQILRTIHGRLNIVKT